MFKSIGEVSSIKHNTNPKGEFLGSGYVSFLNSDLAAEAISKFNGYDFNGNKLVVIKFNKYENRVLNQQFPVIIISNLPTTITDSESLKEMIAKLADVTLCGLYNEQAENFSII